MAEPFDEGQLALINLVAERMATALRSEIRAEVERGIKAHKDSCPFPLELKLTTTRLLGLILLSASTGGGTGIALVKALGL